MYGIQFTLHELWIFIWSPKRLWGNRYLWTNSVKSLPSFFPSVPRSTSVPPISNAYYRCHGRRVNILGSAFYSHIFWKNIFNNPTQTMVGVTLSNFTPKNPPVVPTPDRVYSSAIAAKSKLIFCVPAFLEVCPHSLPTKLSRYRNFRSGLRILRKWMLCRSLMLWYEDYCQYWWQN